MSFYVGSLGGIPIYINLWALLLVAYVSFIGGDPILGVFYAIGILTSVLIHELGHAVVAARYRLQPTVELHFMGGTTQHIPARNDRQDALIIAAGPGVQFLSALLAAGAWLGLALVAPDLAGNAFLGAFLTAFIWVGTFWAIINSLPLWPMDGGKLFHLGLIHLVKVRQLRAARVTHTTSIVVGALLIIGFLWSGLGGFFAIFLFGMMIFQNIQALRATPADSAPRATSRGGRVVDAKPKLLLQQAHRAYKAGEWSEAARLAHQARSEPDLPENALADVYEIIAVSHIRDGKLEEGVRFARRAPPKAVVVEAQVQALHQLRQTTEARVVLRERGSVLEAPVRERLEALLA
jgi:hypothetical protein